MSLGDALDRLGDEVDPTPPDRAAARWQMTLTSDYADVSTGPVEQPILAVGDWDGVLRHFGLDPACFAVCEDKISMSRWQQSRRLDNGDRDVVWMHSYKARFQRITDRLLEADLEALRDRVHKWKPAPRKPVATGLGEPCTFYIGWADWQASKGSVEQLTQRVLDSIEQSMVRIKELRKLGRNITSICVANMGDPLEGCLGHYASQQFTVSATLRQQMNVVLDLWATGLRALAPLADDVLFVSCLSNHGEFNRPPGASTKQLTSDSDNADGFLAETLRRVLSERSDMDHVRYSIPHDQFVTAENLSNVCVGFTHGHKTPGTAKEADWLRAQSLRLRHETGAEPKLWMSAHRHHLDIKDFGFAYRVQHPTLEVAPSKWYADMTGMWSTPGTLTCLVGRHQEAGDTGFSDLAVLQVP